MTENRTQDGLSDVDVIEIGADSSGNSSDESNDGHVEVIYADESHEKPSEKPPVKESDQSEIEDLDNVPKMERSHKIVLVFVAIILLLGLAYVLWYWFF